MEGVLVDGEYLLKKFSGKGGWTYAEIPEVLQDKRNPFGWVKVRGMIDGFELKSYKLMPMGNGKLFLPVRAEIRKAIRKKEGDWVRVVLYRDDANLDIPDEILECFEHEPAETLETFLAFTEGEQKAYLDWIYSAKTEDTKASRILRMMERLAAGMKWHDKEEENGL